MDPRYTESDGRRRVVWSEADRSVELSAPLQGYGMLVVAVDGEEVERYYGLDMAVDHVAELLKVPPRDVELPEEARDMGM